MENLDIGALQKKRLRRERSEFTERNFKYKPAFKTYFFLQFSGTIALHLGHVKCNQGRVMDVWNGHYQDNALMAHFFSPLGT